MSMTTLITTSVIVAYPAWPMWLAAKAVRAGGAGGGDRVDDLAAVVVGHFTEDGVLAVEPGGGPDGEEELRPVGTRARVRHREQVRPAELEIRVDLVTELVPRPAPPGTGRVPALDHEAADHAVEDGAVVVRTTRSEERRV